MDDFWFEALIRLSSLELWENLHLALAVCVHAVVTLSVHPPRVCALDEKKEKMKCLCVDTRYVAGASLSSF